MDKAHQRRLASLDERPLYRLPRRRSWEEVLRAVARNEDGEVPYPRP